LNTLAEYLEKLTRESSTPYLFPQAPRLSFRSARSDCPECQAPLKVKKTRSKKVHTLLLGAFRARETLLHCESCRNPVDYPSEALGRLAPSGCRFGYDVIVFVGKTYFLEHRRTEEIRDRLRSRNMPISAGEIEYLAKKFVVYLALAHRESAPRLKEAMSARGGYILHLDGTCEGGGPMLVSSLDSISEIVLGNVKVPSEKASEIVPLLEQIKLRYGNPVAAVHDMGKGILAAVKQVFPDVPDFICHFHFLRDIGKDLIEADYERIRKRLRHHGITGKLLRRAREFKAAIDRESDPLESFSRNVHDQALSADTLARFPLLCAYSLIQWALEAKSAGDGYGFPFDRPHWRLARRLVAVYEQLERIDHVYLRGQWRDNIPLWRVSRELKKIAADRELRKSIKAIEGKIEVFDQLRVALRIAQPGGSSGLNSGGEPIAMGAIQKAMERFRRKITSRCDYAGNRPWQTMIAQIDKYWEKLFADLILVQGRNGPHLIQPQRTNNIMERFFRDLRRGVRRKCGHNSMGKFLQSMIADTPLVRNLENSDYLEVLLDGHRTLEECFADIDVKSVRQEMDAAQRAPEKVPAQIRRLIATPDFPGTLARLFQKAA